MSSERLAESAKQPEYHELQELILLIDGDNGAGCLRIYEDYKRQFVEAPGSRRNHQAWPGGYNDHVTEVMNIASTMYDTLEGLRELPFTKSDALLILFLHDLEKPFKYTYEQGVLVDNKDISTKAERAGTRNKLIDDYNITLTPPQLNALYIVEGMRDADYSRDVRQMGELAAFCHTVDTLSARLWYNYPLPENKDGWRGAKRVNPAAGKIMLPSELVQFNG